MASKSFARPPIAPIHAKNRELRRAAGQFLGTWGQIGLSESGGVTDVTPRRGPMSHSTDAEIRRALHRKALRAFHRNDTLVIDELGLAHAKAESMSPSSMASLHGFGEIESAADTLMRQKSHHLGGSG